MHFGAAMKKGEGACLSSCEEGGARAQLFVLDQLPALCVALTGIGSGRV